METLNKGDIEILTFGSFIGNHFVRENGKYVFQIEDSEMNRLGAKFDILEVFAIFKDNLLRDKYKIGRRENSSQPEIPPSDYLALLTGKQLTEREKPCANCKETIAECACMRNICVKCNKPVGNITFSHCDKCFDILHSEPTQESVKERNGDPSMDEMIQLVEQLESDKFHLQQQLKQAKEMIIQLNEIIENRASPDMINGI